MYHHSRGETEYIQALEDENARLKDRIAELTGFDDVHLMRAAFGLSPIEARIFSLLVNRGVATYSHIYGLIFSDDDFAELEYPEGAVRSHIKRMRQKIRPRGLDIATVYGSGFEMMETERSAAREILKAYQSDSYFLKTGKGK